MSEDPAPYFVTPVRSQLDLEIDDATVRMRSAVNIEMKLLWARRLVAAKRKRGDYPEIQALDTETEDVLVKQVVLGSVVNQEGERHD